MKVHQTIAKDYPNFKRALIAEAFHPAKGWIRPFGVHLPALTTGNLLRLQNKGYTHVNLHLTDAFGMVRYPDYSIEALLTHKHSSHEKVQ